MVESLGSTNVFSTLDANNGYWQVELNKNDIEKTAFVTSSGLYRYTGMPFELKETGLHFNER